MKKLMLILASLCLVFMASWVFSQDIVTGEEASPEAVSSETDDFSIENLANEQSDNGTASTEEPTDETTTENNGGTQPYPVETTDAPEEGTQLHGLVEGKYDKKLYASSLWKLWITAQDDKNTPDQVGVRSIEVKLDDDDYYEYTGALLERTSDNSVEIATTPKFTVEGEGAHTLEYRSIDNVGNLERGNVVNFMIDNTPPWVEAECLVTEAPPYRVYIKNNIIYVPDPHKVVLRAFDTGVGEDKIFYALNQDDYKEYEGTEFQVPNAGWNILRVKATDLVGNESAEKVYNIFLDNKAPIVNIKPKYALYPSADNKVFFAGIDNDYTVIAMDRESGLSEILIKVDGADIWDIYRRAVSFVTTGKHEVVAKALDNVGNCYEVDITVMVDAIPPESVLRSEPQTMEDYAKAQEEANAADDTEATDDNADANAAPVEDEYVNEPEETTEPDEEATTEEDDNSGFNVNINVNDDGDVETDVDTP